MLNSPLTEQYFLDMLSQKKIVEAIIKDVVHKNAGLTITMNGVTFR